MKVLAVLGGQWGDEGKGKIVDLLADRFDVVARYHGGHNAGHTVKFGDAPLRAPPAAGRDRARPRSASSVRASSSTSRRSWRRSESVRAAGVAVGENLLLSDRAHRHPPLPPPPRRRARANAGAATQASGRRCAASARPTSPSRRAGRSASPSSTGPRRSPRASRRSPRRPARSLRALGDGTSRRPDEVVAALAFGRRQGRAPRHGHRPYLRHRLRSGATLLAEGAHGAMLDLSAGTYPFVTSSHCTSAAVASGSRSRRSALDASLLVLKAYTTRVGAGPFPTELHDATGEFLRKRGNEYGTSTGRPRRTGWFDAVVARTAVELSGADAVAITKLDCLDELDEIPVCVGYRLDGKAISDLPAARRGRRAPRARARELSGLEVHDDRRHALRGPPRRRRAGTSAPSRSSIGAPAVFISTGPRREETIWRADSPFLAALPPPS